MTLDALIPHRGPMQLIDSVLVANDKELCASAALPARSPFARHARVRVAVGLELMAQAAAAFFTLNAGGGSAPRQGMLVSCRDFSAETPYIATDQSLVVHVRIASPLPNGDAGAGLVKFDGTLTPATKPLPTRIADIVQLGAAPIARATFSVYL